MIRQALPHGDDEHEALRQRRGLELALEEQLHGRDVVLEALAPHVVRLRPVVVAQLQLKARFEGGSSYSSFER